MLGIITFFLGNFDWIHQISRVAEACPNHIDESKMKGPYPSLLQRDKEFAQAVQWMERKTDIFLVPV